MEFKFTNPYGLMNKSKKDNNDIWRQYFVEVKASEMLPFLYQFGKTDSSTNWLTKSFALAGEGYTSSGLRKYVVVDNKRVELRIPWNVTTSAKLLNEAISYVFSNTDVGKDYVRKVMAEEAKKHVAALAALPPPPKSAEIQQTLAVKVRQNGKEVIIGEHDRVIRLYHTKKGKISVDLSQVKDKTWDKYIAISKKYGDGKVLVDFSEEKWTKTIEWIKG